MLWIPLKQVEFHRSEYGISNIRQCDRIGISFKTSRRDGRRAIAARMLLYNIVWGEQKENKANPY